MLLCLVLERARHWFQYSGQKQPDEAIHNQYQWPEACRVYVDVVEIVEEKENAKHNRDEPDRGLSAGTH